MLDAGGVRMENWIRTAIIRTRLSILVIII